MEIKVRKKNGQYEATTIIEDDEQKPEDFKDLNEDAIGTAQLFMIQHPEFKEVTYRTKLSKPNKKEREATEI